MKFYDHRYLHSRKMHIMMVDGTYVAVTPWCGVTAEYYRKSVDYCRRMNGLPPYDWDKHEAESNSLRDVKNVA